MKQLWLILLAAFFTIGCGQKDSRDKIMRDQIQAIRNVTAVLQTVVDLPTAQAAAVKLKPIDDSIPAILERDRTLGPVTQAERKVLIDKYLAEQTTVQNGFQAELARIAKLGPEVLVVLGPGLNNLFVPEGGPSLPPVPPIR